MEYILLKSNSDELKLDIEHNKVYISYFSIFDKETMESDSIQLSFYKEKFLSELKKSNRKGFFEIEDSACFFSFSKAKSGYDFTIRRKDGSSFLLFGIPFDIEKLINILE